MLSGNVTRPYSKPPVRLRFAMKLLVKYITLVLAFFYVSLQIVILLWLKLNLNQVATLYPKQQQNNEKLYEELTMRKTHGYKLAKTWLVSPSVPSLSPPYNDATNDIKKILIIATWRTGSTFLGAIIQSTPGVFYSYEPLFFKDYPGTNMEFIHQLFNCNFDSNYLRRLNDKNSLAQFMTHNTRVWAACNMSRTLCSNPNFVRRQCLRLPYHLIKVVRLRLKELVSPDEILPDNTKVIYLARDPRGIMASRSNVNWCVMEPGCNDVARLCMDMSDDLKILRKLIAKEPERYYFLRFEDLAANVEEETQKLFDFLRIPMTEAVEAFLEANTKAETHNVSRTILEDPHSIVRQSNKVAKKWRNQLLNEEINAISETCTNVLRTLNYDTF